MSNILYIVKTNIITQQEVYSMKNEITTTTIIPSKISFTLEGNDATTAIGYIVLSITALSICAMFRGYTVKFGSFHITPSYNTNA